MTLDRIEELAQWVLTVEADRPEDAQRVWSVFADALEEHFGPKHSRTRMARDMAEGPWNKLARFIACFGDDYTVDWYRLGQTKSNVKVSVLSVRWSW